MKIVVDNKSFVSAINWVTKAFDSQQRNPQINLKVDESGVGVLYLDSGITFMRDTFTVFETTLGDKKEFTASLDGQYMQKLSGVLSKVDDSITLKDSKKGVVIEAPHGNLTIPTEIKKAKSEPVFIELGEVDDREYFDSLQRVSKICNTQGGGSIAAALNSVNINLDYENEKIILMGTDRYTLAEITVDFKPDVDNVESFIQENDSSSVLLPVESALKVSPSKGLISTVTIITDEQDGRFGYSFDDGRIALFTLNNGKAIDYKNLKKNANKGNDNKVVISNAEFRNAMQIVASLNWEEVDLFMDISENGFIIRDEFSTNNVEVDSTIELDEDAEKFIVSFNRSVINKSVIPMGTDQVRMRWGAGKGGQVFVFEPILDDGSIDTNVFVFCIAKSSIKA